MDKGRLFHCLVQHSHQNQSRRNSRHALTVKEGRGYTTAKGAIYLNGVKESVHFFRDLFVVLACEVKSSLACGSYFYSRGDRHARNVTC